MGRKAPRVRVSHEVERALLPAGKRCAPMGTLHLPGTVQRCQSAPNMVLTSPIGWAADTLRSSQSKRDEFREHRYESAKLVHAMTTGAWGDLTSTLRPGTAAPMGPTAGGKTQGARDRRPSSVGNLGKYEADKHGWYHPLGQAETRRLKDMDQEGSYVWIMQKSNIHTGYGPDGRVNRNDVQITAVSGNGPDWLIGTRTLPGPFTTKKVPVRRCPMARIEGDEMKVRGKTYEQGEGLSIIETLHDTAVPPPQTKVPRPELPAQKAFQNKAKWDNLIHGGCESRPVFQNNVFPPSNHITYETHDTRDNPANKTLRRKAHGITIGC